MRADENIVEITQMSFDHGNGPIFKDVNMVIKRGKVTAIMGPSGTGKTTLLRLIGGQLQPSKGQIKVAEHILASLNLKELYNLRKSIGMMFQTGGLFTHLNVFENVAFPLREHTQLSESMIRTLVLLKLQMVGLRGAHQLMPNELSGGMARRVALARAIILDPALVLYDEPFTGQDPISMGILVKLVRTLNDALGVTSVIVSHDVLETLSIADYVYVIVNQEIIGEGTPESIFHQPSNQLKQFMEGLPDGPVAFDYPAIATEKDFLKDFNHAR